MKKKTLCIIMTILIAASAIGCGSVVTNESITDADGGMTDGTRKSTGTGAETAATAGAGFDDDAPVMNITEDSYAAADVEASPMVEAAETDPSAVKGTDDESEKRDLPEAGQLTAGEWNDNENWGFFSNLVNSGKIAFPSFGLDPIHRVTVEAKDKSGKPLANAKAVLTDKSGKTLFSGVTNKDGIAYLFGNGDNSLILIKNSLQFTGGNSGQTKTEDVKDNANDLNAQVVLDTDSKPYKAMDIMFILDTTGSMSDEMLFLQSEFTAITQEIGTTDTRYAMNFYRDDGDEYITRCNDFTTDIKAIQKAINNESADGGGDYPEAVAEVLKESVSNSSWKEDSVKLAFLIFDAPPHAEKAQEIAESVTAAAEKGIRIIPVIASDSDRDTELFGRAAAIYTGGTYVFLTDDSGIGNSHEEPIIGSYEVKSLYDTIIEIVNNYRQ